MVRDDLAEFILLRLAVGFLGETENAAWWRSMWFTKNATAFLAPIYGNRLALAQYHGVVEAARRVHDDRIGVGQVFHLFRLPQELEQRLHEALSREKTSQIFSEMQTKDNASSLIERISQARTSPHTGPIRIGSLSEPIGGDFLAILASHYRAAFAASLQTFPYFADRE